MKRTILIVATLMMAFSTSLSVSAQTDQQRQILDNIVAAFSQELPAIVENSNGQIYSTTCERSGCDLVINMYLGNSAYNFDQYDEATRNAIVNEISSSFIAGFFGNTDGGEALSIFRSIGTKFIFNLFDTYGNKLSTSWDPANM